MKQSDGMNEFLRHDPWIRLLDRVLRKRAYQRNYRIRKSIGALVTSQMQKATELVSRNHK